MQFEDEEDKALSQGDNKSSLGDLDTEDAFEPTNGQGAPDVKFEQISKLFKALSEARGGNKTKIVKKCITRLFKNCRHPKFTFGILRLLIPEADKERGNYGLKEKALARLICVSLSLDKGAFDRLYHYKNPNYHEPGHGIGDFSICVEDVTKHYFKPTSTLTVNRLNELLDQLADNNIEQKPTFITLINSTNASEFKWIIRIILKDLKLNIKNEVVLSAYHPDAVEFNMLNPNLEQMCRKFENPKVSLSDEVKLFQPIKPMLAGKKKIDFFRADTRIFYIETKYDGQRLQAHIDTDQIKLFSRNGIEHQSVYQDLPGYLRDAIKADACILDGEVIVIDPSDGKMMPFGLNKTPAINHESQSIQICYKIFDILWLRVANEEMNLMSYPLRERKKLLPKLIPQQIPGRVQLVRFRQILDYDDILRQFNASLERNQEGVMLKDPDSIYVPKERKINWLKLKADYVEGMSQSMDVIILGGYYGDHSFRLGKKDSHWTNQVTSFLVGVLEISEQGEQLPYAIPFARVGMGFTGDQLDDIRSRIRDNLYEYKGIGKPAWLRCEWKYSMADKVQCYVKDLTKSVILEIKGSELIPTEKFATDCTLRFSRNLKLRFDKEWNQAMTKEQLDLMLEEANYTKTMKKKNKELSDDEDEPQIISKKNKRKDTTNRKNQKRRDLILDDFVGVDTTKEKLVSHLFHNKQFVVLRLETPFDKHEIERDILLHGGKVVQNPLDSTQYVVTDKDQGYYQIQILHNYPNKQFTFIKPEYIKQCVLRGQILPQSPLYLAVLPHNNSIFYRESFDKYGDSYTGNLDELELNHILSYMGPNHPINNDLIEVICMRKERSQKISIAFDVPELYKVQLKRKGNRFTENINEEVNSIIVSERSYEKCIQLYKDSIERFHIEVQILQHIVNFD